MKHKTGNILKTVIVVLIVSALAVGAVYTVKMLSTKAAEAGRNFVENILGAFGFGKLAGSDAENTADEDKSETQKLVNDYTSGALSNIEKSEAVFLAAFFPEDKADTHDISFNDESRVDVRSCLQVMVNAFDELDSGVKEKLLKIIYPENFGRITVKEAYSGGEEGERSAATEYLKLLGIKSVWAADDDDLYPPMSFGISPGISVKTHDMGFMEEYGTLISTIVHDAGETFALLEFSAPSFIIEIIPGSLPEWTDSYSVFVPADFLEQRMDPLFRIFIDPERDAGIVEASLVHELFHAWQEEALNPDNPVRLSEERLDWLKEATAMWAVDQVYPDNDYELTYVDKIYRDPTVEYYVLEGSEHYTWYQMFFYFSEIIGDKAPGYVHQLFKNYAMDMNLDMIFNRGHLNRGMFNHDFAEMGMALFGGVESYKRFNAEESSYPVLDMLIKSEDKIALSDITADEDEESDWREYEFTTPGFHYVLISIPDDFNEKLIFQQSLSMVREEQMTGMRIAVKRNGQWQWENFALEPAYHVLDIDGSFDLIDEVLVMFFSSGFEGSEKIRYNVTSGSPDKAKGSIIYKWTKEYKKEKSSDINRENVTVVITENLKKIDAQLPEEQSADASTISYLIFGEQYIIDNLQIDYVYDYKRLTESEEEKLTGSGSFSYVTGEEQQDSLPGMTTAAIPGESISGGASETGDITGDIQEDAVRAYEELMEGLLPSLEQAEDMLGSETEGLISSDELQSIMDALKEAGGLGGIADVMPGTGGSAIGQNAMSRIVIRPETGVFELLPSLPPRIYEEEWVSFSHEYKYAAPDKPGGYVTETKTYKDKPSELFPLWFMNPDYQEEYSPYDALSGESWEAEDTEELAQMIAMAQAKGNKLNIQKMLNDPWMPFTVDFSDMIQPAPLSAKMTEKAAFSRKDFKAELSAETLTEKENIIRISISVQYGFY